MSDLKIVFSEIDKQCIDEIKNNILSNDEMLCDACGNLIKGEAIIPPDVYYHYDIVCQECDNRFKNDMQKEHARIVRYEEKQIMFDNVVTQPIQLLREFRMDMLDQKCIKCGADSEVISENVFIQETWCRKCALSK